MATAFQQTSSDFVYSYEIVPLANLLPQNFKIWLLRVYQHHPGTLKYDLPALKEAIENKDEAKLRAILRKYRSQDEPPIANAQ